MNRIKLILFLFLIVAGQLFSQSQFQEFIQHLSQRPTVEEKETAIDSFMTFARTVGIPFIEGNEANFIYNKSASSVVIAGDFNGWNPGNSEMTNISGTNFFYQTETFELNARMDYKFIVNGSTWILDPENPNRVSGGLGPNSELAMPDYIQPWEINYNPSIQHGERTNFNFLSTVINRYYNVTVYLPPSYNTETAKNYPTVYFQDGGEYISLGSSINVIDNLIDSNKITEVIAVFVTPNNRHEEYAFELRNNYAEFFATELVEHIDANYRTFTAATDRLVLGDSYGGNISGLISYTYPEVFGNCGLHSAAFNPNNYEVYNMIVDGEKKDIKFAGCWGTYESLAVNMNNFRTAIVAKGYSFDWAEYPEGHSWGMWRANIDLILESIFPYSFTSTKDEVSPANEFELFQNYPNPFNPATTIKYSIRRESEVKIEITDTLGQRIELLVDETKSAGTYSIKFDGSNYSSGVYIYSITSNGKTLSKKMQLIK